MKRAKGCLLVFAVLLLLGIVINLLELTWPVGLPTIVAVVCWRWTLGSKKPVIRATNTVLGAMSVGLLLVCALLFVFNVTSASKDMISKSERALVYLDNHLKLSPVLFVVVIVGLLTLAYWIPNLRLVERFSAINKLSSRGAIALGAATSFSFFTNVAVVQPKTPRVYLKIEALYRNSRIRESKASDRFLAARAVQRALANHQSSERHYFELLLDGVRTIPTMNLASKQSLAEYLADHLYNSVEGPLATGQLTEIERRLPHGDALSILDKQLASEKAATWFADEAVKAAKESLSFGKDELRDIVWAFVEKLIGQQAEAVDQLVRPFVDEISDEYLEKYIDPIVERRAAAVRRLFQHAGTGTADVETAANSAMRSAIELMNSTETRLARDAAEQAVQAAKAAQSYSASGDMERCDAELGVAERASVQAVKAADFARSASEAMLASNTLKAESGAVAEVSAIRAAEVARAIHTAAEAAEAAKAAKATLEAVEAAKATKNAEKAAEAAKLLLKAIPK